MKKHLLLLTALLCLCVNSAWGYTLAWQGEAYTNGTKVSNFYLYNAGTMLWLGHNDDNNRVPGTYSDKSKADLLWVDSYNVWGDRYGIKTQIGNTAYWLKSSGGTSSWAGNSDGGWTSYTTQLRWNAGDRTNLSNAFSIDCEHDRFMTAAGNGVQLKFYTKGDTAGTKCRTWLFISKKQYDNHDKYEEYLTLKETIDNDGSGKTKYQGLSSYTSFSNAYDVDFVVTTANLSDIETAYTNLDNLYETIKVEYAEANKASKLEELDDQADEAEDLLNNNKMNGTVRTNLANSIAAARVLTSAIGDAEAIADINAADITSAESDLAAKVAAAETSIGIYERIDALVTRANEIVEGFDRSGQAGFNLNAVTTAYDNETITDGATQKNLIFTSVQAAALRQTSLNADMSYALINPNLETGDLTGWDVTANLAATKGVYSATTRPSAVGDLSNVSGTYYFVTYDSSMDTDEGYNISQDVTLPAGSYELTVGIAGNTDANDNKINVYFYDQKVTKSKSEYSKTSLTDVSVSLTLTEAKTVTIKVSSYGKSNVNSWFECDNFRLKLTSARQTLLSGKTSSTADASNYGMFYCEEKVKLADGSKAFVASWDYENGALSLTQLSNAVVPAETPVLVEYATSSTLTYTSTDETPDEVASNAFEIHNYSTSSGHKDYVLASHTVDAEPLYNLVAFHRYEAADETKINGKIVLVWTEPTSGTPAPSMFRIVTDSNTATALVPVYEEENTAKPQYNNQIYTILGVPVNDMSRPGIYIQNGKKYVVR